MIERLLKILNEEGLSIPLFFVMYDKVFGSINNVQIDEIEFENLADKKWIKILDHKYYQFEVREKFNDLLKRIDEELLGVKSEVLADLQNNTKKKNTDIGTAQEIRVWIDEYRNLFRGLRPGSMGDKGACLNKMVKFYNTYPEFADRDTVLAATQKYIDVEGMNNNYRFLQKAHYFIFKQVAGKDSEVSNLASYCEEVGEVEQSFTKML